MATLRTKRKLAAVQRETPENTRNTQSRNAIDPRMAQEHNSQVCEEIEGRVTKKLSQELSRTELPILCALSKLDEFLLKPQVRTCSVAVSGASRDNDSENREPTGDRSPGNLRPEAMFSTYHSNNVNNTEQDETSHKFLSNFFRLGLNNILALGPKHVCISKNYFFSNVRPPKTHILQSSTTNSQVH